MTHITKNWMFLLAVFTVLTALFSTGIYYSKENNSEPRSEIVTRCVVPSISLSAVIVLVIYLVDFGKPSSSDNYLKEDFWE